MSNNYYATPFSRFRHWFYNCDQIPFKALIRITRLSFYADWVFSPSMRRAWRYVKDQNLLSDLTRAELWYTFCDKPHRLRGMDRWSYK